MDGTCKARLTVSGPLASDGGSRHGLSRLRRDAFPDAGTLGSGSPGRVTLVLIHGWATSAGWWSRLVPLLEASHVLCPDLPGFGASLDDTAPPTFDHHVGEVERLVSALAPGGPVVLVGHSYGGLVAQEIVARRPDLIDALVLLSSQSRARPFILTEKTKDLVRSIGDHQSKLVALWQVLPRYYHEAALSREDLAGLVEDGCRASAQALRETLLSASTAPLLDPAALATKTMPVMAVQGERDILPRQTLDELKALFPACQCLEIEDAGHGAPFEQPVLVASMINSFLSQVQTW